MIVDSSALLAIMRDEPDAALYATALARCLEPKRISAGTWLETTIVIDGSRDPIVSARFDTLIRRAAIEVEPVTALQAALARQAYRDFGKGSGHAARLNYGDCFAYALAKDKGERLLFKGRDFSQTDIEAYPLAPEI